MCCLLVCGRLCFSCTFLRIFPAKKRKKEKQVHTRRFLAAPIIGNCRLAGTEQWCPPSCYTRALRQLFMRLKLHEALRYRGRWRVSRIFGGSCKYVVVDIQKSIRTMYNQQELQYWCWTCRWFTREETASLQSPAHCSHAQRRMFTWH